MANTPRRLMHPPAETPILEWWKADYDHVFAIPNPFFRVQGHDPESSAFGPVHSDISDPEELLRILAESAPERPNEAPAGFDLLVKREGEPIRWDEVWHEIGEPDRDEFNRTVWLWTLQVDRDDRCPDISAALDQYCFDEGLYPPEEDQLPLVLEPLLADYFWALGLREVTLWDEWRRKSAACPVQDLRRNGLRPEIDSEKICALTAPGLILSWSFDDVVGLLGLSDARFRACHPAQHLECLTVGPRDYADLFNPHAAARRKEFVLLN